VFELLISALSTFFNIHIFFYLNNLFTIYIPCIFSKRDDKEKYLDNEWKNTQQYRPTGRIKKVLN